MDFYTQFINRALRDQQFVDKFWGLESDHDWTVMILDFLERWGREEQFDVSREGPTRPDMIWRKDAKIQVVIEHENVGSPPDSLESELKKLLDFNTADHRVLITYFEDKMFKNHVDDVREKLRWRLEHSNSNFTFWFIFGPYGISSPAELMCAKYYPKYTEEIIVPESFPSSSTSKKDEARKWLKQPN